MSKKIYTEDHIKKQDIKTDRHYKHANLHQGSENNRMILS